MPTTDRTFTAATVPAILAVALVLATACGSHAPLQRAGLTFTTFHGSSESVWVAAADGSHARELTQNGDSGGVSADGRWLTFEREEAAVNFVQLFLVDLRTGGTRRLGESTGNERWAPAGARVAFTGRHGFVLYDARSGRRTTLLRSHVASFDFTPGGRAIVLTEGTGIGEENNGLSDLYRLRLRDRAFVRLTHDRHSRSPVVSRTGIAYVRYDNHYGAPEVWWMRSDGTGRRLLARCCETKWFWTHGGAFHGFDPVAVSADGRRLLVCREWEGGCDPVAISTATGRRYTFAAAKQLGTPKEFRTALDLTRNGRSVLLLVHPWDDEPGPRLLYSLPFGGGQPRLLARNVAFAHWGYTGRSPGR